VWARDVGVGHGIWTAESGLDKGANCVDMPNVAPVLAKQDKRQTGEQDVSAAKSLAEKDQG